MCCARHEIGASRFTECCACHEIGTSAFTKRTCHEICSQIACHEICTCTKPATKSALRGSQMLRLPRNLHFEVHKALCLPRNLRFKVHKLCLLRNLRFEVHEAQRLPRNLQTTNHGSLPLHLSRNESASTITTMPTCCTCHEICLSKSKTAPIPCACHEMSTLENQSTRFPLRLSRTVTSMWENARGATTRVQSRQAPAAAAQISRACAVERHVDDLERHECTVNSSELVGHGRATQRSNTAARSAQCVHTVWGIIRLGPTQVSLLARMNHVPSLGC